MFSTADVDAIPLVLRGHEHVSLETDAGYEALLRRLFARPAIVIPPLGSAPELPSRSSETSFVRPSEPSDPHREIEASLARWRLFDFQRDIVLDSIYIQEVLCDPTGTSPIRPFLGARPAAKPRSEESVFADLAAGRQSLVAIEGRAGAGKSTMTRSWAIRFLRAGGITPLYVALRYLDGEVVSTAAIAAAMRKTLPDLRPASFTRLRALLDGTGGPACLIADGVDELPPCAAAAFVDWVQSSGVPRPAILTSRPGVLPTIGYPRGVRAYELCDFDLGQIEQFVMRWFVAAAEFGSALFATIAQQPKLARIASIPLLLTCICIDAEIRGACDYPPDVLENDLLRSTVTIMLDRWDAAKERRDLDGRIVALGNHVLQSLISPDHPYSARFPYDALLQRARQFAPEHGLSPEAGEEMIRRVVRAARIVEGRSDLGVAFSHKIFYDFFFAEKIRSLRA